MPPLNDNFIIDANNSILGGNHSNDYRPYNNSSFVDRELVGSGEEAAFQFALPPSSTKTPPGYRDRNRSNKSVSFSDQVEYYPPNQEHNCWPLSEEEKNSRWASAADYGKFQLDVFRTVYMLQNHPESINDDLSGWCARGVECRDPEAVRLRSRSRREAWGVVLGRQKIKRQRAIDDDGDYWIATLYGQVAQASLQLALKFAAQDELYARNIRNEEDLHNHNDDIGFFGRDWISCVSSSSPLCSKNTSLSSCDSMPDLLSCPINDVNPFGGGNYDDSWLLAI